MATEVDDERLVLAELHQRRLRMSPWARRAEDGADFLDTAINTAKPNTSDHNLSELIL